MRLVFEQVAPGFYGTLKAQLDKTKDQLIDLGKRHDLGDYHHRIWTFSLKDGLTETNDFKTLIFKKYMDTEEEYPCYSVSYKKSATITGASVNLSHVRCGFNKRNLFYDKVEALRKMSPPYSHDMYPWRVSICIFKDLNNEPMIMLSNGMIPPIKRYLYPLKEDGCYTFEQMSDQIKRDLKLICAYS